jgi:hypothetical protein
MSRHNASKVIPYLDKAMRLSQATNVTLELASEVNQKTIQKARNGCGIRPSLADMVMEAVCTRGYRYVKPGPKGRA